MTTNTIMFPIPILTPIEGKPTTATLQKMKQQLITNAMAIPSNRGNANHGHLYALLNHADYIAATTGDYVAPVNPGVAPNIAPGLAAAQIAEAIRQFQADTAEFQKIDQRCHSTQSTNPCSC